MPDGNYEVRALDADGRAGRFFIDEKTYRLLVSSGQVKPNNRAGPGPIANTVGIIVPKTSANLQGNSAPTPTPEPKEEGWWKRWGSDLTHGVLDVVGLVPVAGEVANLAGAGIYLLEGDKVSAALDLAAMWPAGGQAATAAKYGAKGAEAAAKQLEKKAAKEAAEAAERKAAKEAEEAAARKAEKEGGHVKGTCKHLEKGPPGAKHQGGKHGRVKEDSQRGVRESHHVPPKSVSPHGETNGPAISMDYGDHRALSSTGRASTHPASIAQQRLANAGPAGFLAAMTTEIAEIRAKFGNKYDPAIAWMLLWAACMGYIPGPAAGGKK